MKQVIPRKRKRGIPWIGWSVALTIIGAGSFLGYSRVTNPTNTNAISVNSIEVKTGTIEDIISESGIVELEAQQTLKARLDGTVGQVLVRIGDRFATGQTLIWLEDPQREISTKEQNLNLQKKQLDLAAKKQGLADAIIDLKLKEKKLQTELQLLEKGFISENEFQTQQEQVRQAKSKLTQAQQALSSARLDLQLQELERQKKLAEQKKNLVIAPVSGKVLDIKVRRGDVVKLGDSILTLGNPQQQIIRMQISTLNASKVKLGQEARIRKIGPEAKVYRGIIESISLIASKDNNSENSPNSSQPTVSATVKLDAPTQELIPGSQVNVDIVLLQKKDIPILPTGAIVQNFGQPFVWVKSDLSTAKKQPVTLGLEGLTNVEIISGLKPGDKVIQPLSEQPLQPGMKVRSTGNE